MIPPTPPSDTPETDTHILAGTPITWEVVRADFARSLERRLREAEETNRKLRDDIAYLTDEAAMQRRLAEAAERRVEREGLPWCEVHGPYRGSGCPRCFSAAPKDDNEAAE